MHRPSASNNLHKFIFVLFAFTWKFIFMTRLPTCSSMPAIRNWRKPWTGPIELVRSCYWHSCEQLQQRPVDTTMKWQLVECNSTSSNFMLLLMYGIFVCWIPTIRDDNVFIFIVVIFAVTLEGKAWDAFSGPMWTQMNRIWKWTWRCGMPVSTTASDSCATIMRTVKTK